MDYEYYTITASDPLLFRDGRPFTADLGSLSAKSLPLPLPGTLAGMLRTRYGEVTPDWAWNATTSEAVRRLEVTGPVLVRNGEPVFPAPADAVVYKKEEGLEVARLAPLSGKSGTNIPDDMKPLSVTQEFKPEPGYLYWSMRDMERWLTGETEFVPDKIEGPPRDERTHVGINKETHTAKDGMLFTTEGICLGKELKWNDARTKLIKTEWKLATRACEDLRELGGTTPFGGERRIAMLEEGDAGIWQCPEGILKSLRETTHIRLVLATPAIFSAGWKPTWLENQGLTLVAAAVKRREPVSGWDYASNPRGPKPVRWMVPAGSVFFFTCEQGMAEGIASSLWLKPVSDADQDRSDGYGLALWGKWDYAQEKGI